MSESIQISPSAAAATQKSKSSSVESANNAESNDDSTGFTAVFASYTETKSDTAEQTADENLTELMSQLLPQDIGDDGKALPEQDPALILQAMLLLQPAEKASSLSSSSQLQSIGLFDGQRKSTLNPSLMNPDYFNMLAMQNKQSDSATGMPLNGLNIQLSAAQFNPDTNDALLFNMNELALPVQATSSSLSHSLAAVGLGTATQAATTQTQLAPLNISQNAWETNLGSRLQMFIGKNVQSAEIRLDPPDLGVLEIKIKIINDIANVQITSPHAQVRDALETAVPRLREMFADSGVSLGDVNVSQESFSQQQNTAEQETKGIPQTRESDLSDESLEITRKIVSNNLLDMYA